MAIKHSEKWERYKLHGDQTARAELIREYVPLVRYVVNRMSLKLPRTLDKSDLVAAGTLGMIGAVGAFDLDRGVEFSTFAVPRIRGAILDELRSQDWVPRTARRRAAQINAVMNTCRDDGGLADLDRVAERVKMQKARLLQLLAHLRPASFVPLERADAEDSEDGMSVSQILKDERAEDPRRRVELAEQCRVLRSALEMLPEPQRSLICQHYFKNREQKDIAKELRVSRSRVSQIHTSALINLRKRLEALGAA